MLAMEVNGYHHVTWLVSNLPARLRCAVGADWWFYGDSCQHRGSLADNRTLALASSLSVLGVMLVVTLTTAICLKKKYKKQGFENSLVMGNMGRAA